jgi:hypothetical protein
MTDPLAPNYSITIRSSDMKQMKHILVYCLLVLVPCAVLADQTSDMMSEYMKMGDNAAKNFPKELEGLLPKGVPIKSKTYVYEETQNMILCLGIQGEKNDARKFHHAVEIQVGVMGYNPRTAGYMAATWPTMAQQAKQYGKMDGQKNHANWVFEPVTKSVINGADVYIQKGTARDVEIDDFKKVDYVYYTAEASLYKNNMVLTIRIVNMPDRIENVNAAIKEITAFFLATNWNKYLK